MRVGVPILISVAMLAASCSSHPGLPQPGDTVSPQLVDEPAWEPGSEVDLYVALSARDRSGYSRQLGFGASPVKNPVALVQFFGADGAEIASENVELSIRC